MKTLLVLAMLSHGADAGTSLWAFHRGATEANPIIFSTQPALFSAEMVGGATLEWWALKKLETSHPRLAKTFAVVSIGVRGSVAVHNVQVANH